MSDPSLRSGQAFGPLLTQLREARNLSQGELSRRAGLDHSTISRVEAGQRCPTAATVARLVAVLEDIAPLLIEEVATIWWASGRLPPMTSVEIMRALLVAGRTADAAGAA